MVQIKDFFFLILAHLLNLNSLVCSIPTLAGVEFEGDGRLTFTQHTCCRAAFTSRGGCSFSTDGFTALGGGGKNK